MGEIAVYPYSVVVYIVLFATSVLIAYLAEKKDDGRYVILLVLVIGFVSGVRAPDVGIDTLNFYEKFNSPVIYGVESGYVWWMKLFGSFGTFTTFLLVTELLTYGFLFARFWELRNKASFVVSTSVFFALYYFLSLNIMRQFLVVSIVFWATRYLFMRKYGVFSVIVLACTCIHTSSLIALSMLAVIPFRLKEECGNRRTLLLYLSLMIPFAMIAIILYLPSSSLIDTYQRYLDGSYGGSGGSGLLTSIKIALVLFACVLIKGEKRLSSLGIFLAVCVVIGLSGNYLNNVLAFTNRITLYFSIFEPVFWGWCIYSLKGSSRYIILLPLILVFGYSFFSSMAVDAQGVMPYIMTSIPIL